MKNWRANFLMLTNQFTPMKHLPTVWKVACMCAGFWAIVPTPGWGQVDWAQQVQMIEKDIQRLQILAKSKPNDPLILTELAGRYLNLGDTIHENEEERISAYEQGARLAKVALETQEDLADAHFFYAANLGSATQLQGVMASALVVRELRAHAERAVELQEDHAPALHMLGKMMDELPWVLGGDQEMALMYLQKAVLADEYYAHARLDLAKLYLKRHDVSAAAKELQKVLRHPSREQSWAWRHHHKPEAESMLRELKGQVAPMDVRQ